MARRAATPKKSRTKKDRDREFLEEVAFHNAAAMREGPTKIKKFSRHDLKDIRPKNARQEQMFEAYMMGNNVVASGSAGTGKTFCAFFLALNDIFDHRMPQDHIVLVRSNVPTREVGHLPGELHEKMAVFEAPYHKIVRELMPKTTDAYNNLKEAEKIKFVPTSFVRGDTWDNAIVIVDEVQSMNWHEINSVVTRLGENSRLIICGDIAQNDLIMKKHDQSGIRQLLNVTGKMRSFDVVSFTREDIVRSAFVKEWIIAVEDTPE
jgi:phosphate starvation-inducible protein PhoH